MEMSGILLLLVVSNRPRMPGSWLLCGAERDMMDEAVHLVAREREWVSRCESKLELIFCGVALGSAVSDAGTASRTPSFAAYVITLVNQYRCQQ